MLSVSVSDMSVCTHQPPSTMDLDDDDDDDPFAGGVTRP